MADNQLTKPQEVSSHPERDPEDDEQVDPQVNARKDDNGILNSSDANTLIVSLGGQRVGYVALDPEFDFHFHAAQTPPGLQMVVSARLIVDGEQYRNAFGSTQNPQSPSPQHATASDPASSTSGNAVASRKRPAAKTSDSGSTKRPKLVAENAQPIAKKPASCYDKAIEEPSSMIKAEGDTCLTCIRYDRKCKGTALVMVKGAKRCQACAESNRVCQWPNRSNGIRTYEDGQRINNKRLGGRRLEKNTRFGRQQRQRRAAEQDGQQESDSKEGTEDEGSGSVEEEVLGDTTPSNDVDAALQSAIMSAYHGVYEMITQDLHCPPRPHNDQMADAIERNIRGALEGWGPFQTHLEGIDDEVRQGMLRLVNDKIEELQKRMQ